MRALVAIVAEVADMEVRSHGQHPQAQRGRQHEAEATLQPVYGEEASHHGMRTRECEPGEQYHMGMFLEEGRAAC
jgi:hypothetical protein